MSNPVLLTQGLCKNFGALRVTSNLDLRIEAGAPKRHAFLYMEIPELVAERSQGAERRGVVGQPVSHVRGDNGLLAAVARNLRVEIVTASDMGQHERRLSVRATDVISRRPSIPFLSMTPHTVRAKPPFR